MALTKDKKKEVVASVKEAIDKASSMVFVNFHGMKVEDVDALRGKLHEENVTYVVAKKTLARRAFADSDITGEMPALEGELAIAYTDGDETLPAREVYEFQKKLDGAVTIVGGVFEGKYVDQSTMTEIAQIPGMHTLQAQFVNLINSPIQGLVIALNGIAESKQS